MRAFLVNSGILGHRSVGRTIQEAMRHRPDVTTVALDLGEGLGARDRVIRRLMCWGGAAPTSRFDAVTLARWRREMHTGVLAARRIRAAERRHGPADVLHFHTQATAFASIGRMRRTPSIVSLDITQRLAARDVPRGAPQWQYAACGARDRQIFRAADAIVSPSRWAADDVARDVPERAERVHVLPLPLPLGGFDARWIAARRARAGRGAPARVLFMGGDFPRKGGWDLFEAWRAIAEGATAELHVATDWPIGADAVPAGVSVHRGIRAYTPEWFALWADADVFVMPTTAEAFGIVYQEAAAAGVPAIGTDLNAVPEIIADGETGLLVPVHDPCALAAALRRLIADPDARRRMGVAARARAARLYDPASYGAAMAGLMHAAVSSRRSLPR
ncbi:MAG: glycosyltransferase family 4 protein [Gemmatimonadota bacterium]|nr:glycosyltransferase family 4 protein [Gemmatimonadota bacterium]